MRFVIMQLQISWTLLNLILLKVEYLSGEEGDEEMEDGEEEAGVDEEDQATGGDVVKKDQTNNYIVHAHRNVSSSEIRQRWEGRGSGWNNDSAGGGGSDSPSSLPYDNAASSGPGASTANGGGGWGFGFTEEKVR